MTITALEFSRPFRPLLGTLTVAAVLALASCGTSVKAGEEGNSGTPGGPGAPRSVQALSNDPRVDLPGRVSVFLQVLDANGTPVSGLSGSSFKIYENDVLVSESESSQRIIPQPQIFRSYMHLLIDRSNSVQAGNGQAAVQQGASEFIEAVANDDQNYIKISWFDGSATLHPIEGNDIGFSNDKVSLLTAIEELYLEPPFSTSTNLYGAVYEGIQDLDDIDAVAEAAGVENRALSLVTFTDGTHQAGGQITLEDAVAAIEGVSAAGVAHNAFTIGVGNEIDQSVLVALGPTGSELAANFELLHTAFEAIGNAVSNLANSFYFLSYCSPKTFGTHDLRVSVVESPSNTHDAQFTFSASYFGGGCAFLDIRNHPLIGGGDARVFITAALELTNGSVVVTGWSSQNCTAPGCGLSATAFVAMFRASPAVLMEGEIVEDGLLDPSFGTQGIVVLETAPFDVSGATSIVAVTGGGFVVGGWSRASAQSGVVEASVWSVSGDGSMVQRTDLPNVTLVGQAILDLETMPGGGFAAAGLRGLGPSSFAVWRLQSDLTLDPGFGVDGAVFDPEVAVAGGEGATEVLVDGSRIYAVGRESGAIRIIALDVTGAFDATFGMDGRVEPLTTFGGTTYLARAGDAVLDGAGNLVIGGTLTGAWAGSPTQRDLPAIWRIDSTGGADLTFHGSASSPTFGTGVATLRTGSTNNESIDFGRDTRIDGITLAPGGTILATGSRMNAEGHTDLVQFAFDGATGILRSDYNFLGFLIDDGATFDNSSEGGSCVLVLDSGAIWTLGVSNPMSGANNRDVSTIWVDRDPARAFAPLGQ